MEILKNYINGKFVETSKQEQEYQEIMDFAAENGLVREELLGYTL